jgi:hypothetical protein
MSDPGWSHLGIKNVDSTQGFQWFLRF